MISSSSPTPLDVLALIKAQIDPTLFGPHLLLSNLSHSVRDFLYPNDRTWRKLLNAAGIGRSQRDLEGHRVTKWWRDIAVEVSKHEKEGRCDLCSDSFSSETFLHGEEAPINMCAHVRELNLKSTKLPVVVYSPEQVRDENIYVEAHDKLGDIDCGRFDGNFLACDPSYRTVASAKGLLCSSHPVLAHSVSRLHPRLNC
ncbi:hypothetical protein BDY24DRAFT_382072 [Mrakia frigida]|uniref:uncharacterized protein n=1 Tax=Mrakia frigida TaxID=29902 RepID=UPI003FCBFD5C